MPLFHVHVYRVTEKAEINIQAKDGLTARAEALAKAKSKVLEFKKNDEGLYQALSLKIVKKYTNFAKPKTKVKDKLGRTITYASQSKTKTYAKELYELLSALGHSEAFITDRSSIYDFNLMPARLKKISKNLGVSIEEKDLLIDVAKRMGDKK